MQELSDVIDQTWLLVKDESDAKLLCIAGSWSSMNRQHQDRQKDAGVEHALSDSFRKPAGSMLPQQRGMSCSAGETWEGSRAAGMLRTVRRAEQGLLSYDRWRPTHLANSFPAPTLV